MHKNVISSRISGFLLIFRYYIGIYTISFYIVCFHKASVSLMNTNNCKKLLMKGLSGMQFCASLKLYHLFTFINMLNELENNLHSDCSSWCPALPLQGGAKCFTIPHFKGRAVIRPKLTFLLWLQAVISIKGASETICRLSEKHVVRAKLVQRYLDQRFTEVHIKHLGVFQGPEKVNISIIVLFSQKKKCNGKIAYHLMLCESSGAEFKNKTCGSSLQNYQCLK